ncbi:alpha/beta hydrolase [Cellulomonas carbonis]|uniref:Acyl-CoA thioester hydrolase n=1 Tax=Cellulomonas carbonis T26 TaxID=947969 RepID=A0A0A0BS81_9CELL|nr:alpha/beta fold hydrolase [Cellulomonas carbonis]KGM10811.1 acyl-CoA thioester hydrolase [Cellulomonas carbonis T26]GGC15930.1 acyl-CoA thioester hydrolase [Cellulomonas carbonis]
MTITDLTFTSDGHTLAASLAVPAGDGPFPAVLVLPGSGPVDRDSNHKRLPLDITGALRRALAEAGLVVMAYDKRGVGASPGDWMRVGLDASTQDARAALEVLRGRPEVDASHVVVVGHSEGAIHAARLAAEVEGLAGVALLSASATPGEELLRWQTGNVVASMPGWLRRVLSVLRVDLVARTERNRRQIARTTTDVARIGGQRLNARWHREFMSYDPRVDLARLTVPVLAVTGSKDLQVRPSDLEVIASTVRGPVEVHEVPDVSHILRPQAGAASLAGYRKEVRQPVDERVLRLVVAWVGRAVGVPAQR